MKKNYTCVIFDGIWMDEEWVRSTVEAVLKGNPSLIGMYQYEHADDDSADWYCVFENHGSAMEASRTINDACRTAGREMTPPKYVERLCEVCTMPEDFKADLEKSQYVKKSKTDMLKEVLDYIDDNMIWHLCDLIDELKTEAEDELLEFVFENTDSFAKYFASVKESCEETGVGTYPASTAKSLRRYEYEMFLPMLEKGIAPKDAVHAISEFSEKNPHSKWERFDVDLDEGVYYVAALSPLRVNGAKLNGIYIKHIDGMWKGFFEDDGLDDHMNNFTPIAYDRSFYLSPEQLHSWEDNMQFRDLMQEMD